MATIEILLPKMGESVAEATITKLVVSPSEFVESDEPLVEIATDKVDSEVPEMLGKHCVAQEGAYGTYLLSGANWVMRRLNANNESSTIREG